MANTNSIQLVATSSQSLQIPDGDQVGLDFGTNDYTIEVWVKTPNKSSHFIISKLPNASSQTGYRMGLDGPYKYWGVFVMLLPGLACIVGGIVIRKLNKQTQSRQSH